MDNLWIIYGYGWWLRKNPSETCIKMRYNLSVGMMKLPRYGRIKVMFQTTNQMRKYDEIWETVGGEENRIGLGGMASMMGMFCLRGAVAVVPFVPKSPP